MKMKYKKLVVAIQSATMTSLICSALPSYASDIELYKAPKSSETTLMFMLDVSGSMNPGSNSYNENRLKSLKDGMITLLQGDSSKGISPLPDSLVVGISTFNDKTGRIKLEAKPLGGPSPLSGQRSVYRTIINYKQDISRTETVTKTSTQDQIRTQTSNSKRDCVFIFFCGDYESTGGWTPGDLNTGWTASTGTPIADITTRTDWVLNGAAQQQGNIIAQECVDWNNDATLSCKTWVASSKLPLDFPLAIPTPVNSTYIQGSVSNGNTTTTGPVDGSWGDPEVVPGSQVCKSSGCTRKQTRSKKVETKSATLQNSSWAYTTTTTYGGIAYETHRKKLLREVNALTANSGTPTAFAYAEVAAYLLGQSTLGKSGTGFTESSEGDIRTSSAYKNPSQIDKDKQCNTQGIYFLTDGVPEYSNDTSAQEITQSALNDSAFECTDTDLTASRNFYDDCAEFNKNKTSCNKWKSNSLSKTNWQCMAGLAKRLKNGTVSDTNQALNNPKGVSILTAVVGFGSTLGETSGIYANDVAAAKEWGALGGGKYYSGNNSESVVASVIAFLKDLDKYIPPVTTGSVTIPVDALDTQNIQPWGYFPQFDPKPDAVSASGVSTWLGNLKKYKVVNSVLYDRDSKTITNSNGLMKDDINDYWADISIKKLINKEVNGVKQTFNVKVGGALSQMALGYDATRSPKERRIFTDRTIVQDKIDANQNILGSISSGELTQIGRDDFISTSTNKFKEDPKRAYLLSLLGYPVGKDLAYNIDLYPKEQIYQNELQQVLNQKVERDWLMGAVMHSRPILLTQQGTTSYENNVLTYTNRDDLIVYGSTQGILHVVRAGKDGSDSNAGKEVFAFVPSEMIESQPKAFLSQDNQISELKYGIDGQWTAYTEYVTKLTSVTNTNPTVTVDGGKQWLYGGLRMGGKSYYALDLSGVTSTTGKPKLKFKITPSGTCSTTNPLGCMGQSWSKPTITWVNWQGKRKLVMLVGGGYDKRYESSVDYNSSEIDEGAGIYMFDADDGTLLWWASSNVGSANSSTNKSYHANLNKSVVGGIKAIDRNADGITDHLYFGDLGGQLWRVDLSNHINAGVSGSEGENFAKHVVRILDMSGTDAPRFYSTPTFTIHNSNNTTFGAVSIGSGNLSYPMSAKDNATDAVYVVYDKDVARRNLMVLKDSISSTELYTKDVKTSASGGTRLIKNVDGNSFVPLSNGGWYYVPGNSKRILNDPVAIDSDLYVSIFDATKDITNVGCSGGVRGESNVAQFCLPFGQCVVKKGTSTEVEQRPSDIFLGKGNIGISFGGIDTKRGLVLNLPTDKPLKSYQGKTKFISQRWYER
ncbi:pilus assembly protein PilY [Acinetobacter sp. ANC 4218]|uniref:PilC/PilY family type IV pilus protein n=1 Tax=Acinetobacter sp. ANC 4218 TaxID=1977880 RepID=UPI000A357FAC|nr:PilC/PilY family type IV pilus protein [Acinetobacter sp. ANC 4218]OTG70173.1 pilus assembly protein PilY [Acinetobacter sp. ANC 4218]